MWKKIIGYFLIVLFSLTIVMGLYITFNKSPYCEWLAGKYDSSNPYYADKYVEEFIYPSGQCYNRFLGKSWFTNLITLGVGMYLVGWKSFKIN